MLQFLCYKDQQFHSLHLSQVLDLFFANTIAKKRKEKKNGVQIKKKEKQFRQRGKNLVSKQGRSYDTKKKL